MNIWIDSADTELILKYRYTGIIHGVTTNPMILSTQNDKPIVTISRLLDIQLGFVAVQVVSTDTKGMVAEAKKISQLSNRTVIKVPCTLEGLKAMHDLVSEGIKVFSTAVYNPGQYLLAARTGVQNVALYLGKIYNYQEVSLETLLLKSNSQLKPNIMAAAIRDESMLRWCITQKFDDITLAGDMLGLLFTDDPNTVESTKELNKAFTDKFGEVTAAW